MLKLAEARQAYRTEIRTITPSEAREMLARNGTNRRLRRPYVAGLAREITEGRWQFNGAAIVQDADETLLDGQHRLEACVLANLPIKSLVIVGVHPSAITTINASRVLTAGDLLGWADVKESTLMAGACAMQWRYQRGISWNETRRFPSPGEVLETMIEHPLMQESVAPTRRVRSLMFPATAVFLHYQFSKRDRTIADLFFDAVANGTMLSETSPMLVLRERFLSAKRGGTVRTLRRVEQMALVIKAWNLERAGRGCRLLKFLPTEQFPEIAD